VGDEAAIATAVIVTASTVKAAITPAVRFIGDSSCSSYGLKNPRHVRSCG
jgi:hypothetical protein